MNTQANTPVRSLAGIDEYHLPNGLTALLLPDASQDRVTVNITYCVGSRHEGRGEAGMAHLLEHMLFKGTPDHPDVKAVLRDRGAVFNATTWLDRTHYYETLPATDDNLRFALRLEADRMVNSWIREEDLRAEMTVVRNEFEMGENNPLEVLHDQILAAAYLWHPYGKSTIGNRSDIERVPADKLRVFYRHHYQPDNATLVVAGRFEPRTTLQWIHEIYGPLPKPERVLEDTYTEEPAQDGPRAVKLMRAGDVAYAAAAYHIPAGRHEDFPAILTLARLLGHEPGGRLYHALVRAGHASEISCHAYALAEPGMLLAHARPCQASDVDTVRDKLIHELQEGCLAEGITQERVRHAKARLLKSMKLTLADSHKLALALSETIAQGDWRLGFWLQHQLEQVTVDSVRDVAKRYLLESNRTSGIFIPLGQTPTRAHITPAPSPQDVARDAENAAQIKPGETARATHEAIEQRCRRSRFADNTLHAALLPKQTRGDLVRARLILRFGHEEAMQGRQEALTLLPQLLEHGSKQRNHEQVQARLDELQSTLSLEGGPGCCAATILSDAPHLEDVLALVAELWQQPALDSDEFQLLVRRELDDLRELESDPQRLALLRLRQLQQPWPSDSIHHIAGLKQRREQLQGMEIGTLRKLHEHLYGTGRLDVAVVGACDPDRVHARVQELFGSWHGTAPFTRLVRPHKANDACEDVINVPDKQMALAAWGLSFPLQDSDPDYPALRLGTYVLGEGMTSRVMTRLREREGLSYGAGAWLQASSLAPAAHLSCYAMCATQNAQAAQRCLREEYDRFVQQGINDKELTEAKGGLRESTINQLAKDAAVVHMLAKDLELQRTFAFHADRLTAIQSLTREQVNEALRRHLRDLPLSGVLAGDFR